MPSSTLPGPAPRRRRRPAAAGAVALVAAGLLVAACGSSGPSGSSTAGRSSSGGSPAPGGSGAPAGAPASLSAAAAPWTLPVAGSRQVVCWDGSGLVEMGGLVTGDTSTAAVRVIDPSTGAVTATGRLADPVHDAAGACLGGHAFVFGGGTASTVATVQEWSPSAGATVAGSLPAPRSDLASAVVGSTAYVVGGYDGTAMQPDILSTTDGTTFTVAGQLQVPVRYPAVTVADGDIWVIGGQVGTSESGGGQTDVIQRFDPRTGTTTVVGHMPEPLGHASAVFLGDTVWVVGGVTGTTTSAQVWAVDPSTGAVRAAGSLPAPVSDAGTATVGSTAYLLGGEGPAGPTAPLDTVLELRVAPGGSSRG